MYTWPTGSWYGSVSGFKSYIDPLRGAPLGTESVWMGAHFGGAGLTATSQPTDFTIDANFTYHNNSQGFTHLSTFPDSTCINCHQNTLTGTHEGRNKITYNPVEDFEDGDFTFNFTGLWGGDWSRVTETVYSGTYSFKSVLVGRGISGPAPAAGTQTTVNVASGGTLSFWYKVTNGAYPLYFFIDGTQKLAGTSTAWSKVEYQLAPGSHMIKWSTGGNSAYIDDLSVWGASTSNNMGCNTCHLSSDSSVKTAIAGRNTGCSACHSTLDHETPHNSSLDSRCQNCHLASLAQEHMNNPKTTGVGNYTCDTCHASTSGQVRRAIASGSLSCAGCHNKLTTHQVSISEDLPANLPLYEGFNWSGPVKSAIFAGDTNYPSGFEHGLVVFSGRRKDVTCLQVVDFYSSQMAAAGWTAIPEGAVPNAASAIIRFTKQESVVLLSAFSAENSDGTGKQDLGCKIELWCI